VGYTCSPHSTAQLYVSLFLDLFAFFHRYHPPLHVHHRLCTPRLKQQGKDQWPGADASGSATPYVPPPAAFTDTVHLPEGKELSFCCHQPQISSLPHLRSSKHSSLEQSHQLSLLPCKTPLDTLLCGVPVKMLPGCPSGCQCPPTGPSP